MKSIKEKKCRLNIVLFIKLKWHRAAYHLLMGHKHNIFPYTLDNCSRKTKLVQRQSCSCQITNKWWRRNFQWKEVFFSINYSFNIVTLVAVNVNRKKNKKKHHLFLRIRKFFTTRIWFSKNNTCSMWRICLFSLWWLVTFLDLFIVSRLLLILLHLFLE